jgi:hypothetical protein
LIPQPYKKLRNQGINGTKYDFFIYKKMNMEKMFNLFLSISFFFNAFSQENSINQINQLNNAEQKEGLWVDNGKYRQEKYIIIMV